MKYLLIDNTSLRHLIDNKGFSRYIQELEVLISSNRVELIVHELLIQEWNKHKEKWRHDKERKIKYSETSGTSYTHGLIPLNFQVSVIHLDEQIKKIDTLLHTAKIKLKTPEGIGNETYQRIRENLAPFHKKKDSLNDWEIFGSAASYCTHYGIDQLFFISHNHNEFEHEDKLERRIHSSLEERFKTLNIVYYRNVQDFFNELEDENSFPVHLLKYQLIPSTKYSFTASLKSNVLDGLYSLYSEKYREVNFIPIHLLKKNFPFASSESDYPYYYHFKLTNVNERLLAFFDNIIITENKEIEFKDEKLIDFVSDFKMKTKYVLQKLTENLIFDLSDKNNQSSVCTHLVYDTKCNCYRCCFYRFEFSKSLSCLSDISSENKERLKKSYIHYKFGNFEKANTIYETIVDDAINCKEYLSHFLAKYNQRHLANFLRNPFTHKVVNENLVRSLDQIDPIEEAVKLKGYTDYNFLIFIAQEDYFNNSFQAISQIVNDILAHYYSQLTGGWSSNSNIWNLIEEFAKLDAFLNSNYIIYDYYSNFSKLFEVVTEGLFASHAITLSQDRFENFDDYWIHKFITYGNRKTIIKFFNKFYLKSLKYKSSDKSDDCLESWAKNLLDPNETKIIKENLDVQNNFFGALHNKLVQNLLTMCSLLDIDERLTNEIAKDLLTFLRSQTTWSRHDYVSVNFYLEQKFKNINKELLLEYFDFFIFNHTGFDEDSLENIIACFPDNSLEIPIESFQRLFNDTFFDCALCGREHSPRILLSLFGKLRGRDKKRIISVTFSEKLCQDFKFDLFYSSLMYDAIEVDKLQILSLVKSFKHNENFKTFSSLFAGAKYFQNSYLDQLINLCFKYKINTSADEFKGIKNFHPYYDWLTDMDEFDYSNFNVEWVLVYQVYYYYEAMSRSKKLKQFLTNYLKNEFHTGVEKLLLRITCFV